MSVGKAREPQIVQPPRFAPDARKLRKIASEAALQLAALLAGALLALSRFAGGLFLSTAPFAVAAAAAAPVRLLGAQVLGTTLGCLLFLPYPQAVSVMAAAAAAGLTNLAFRRLGVRRQIHAPICAALCSAASGAASLLAPQEDALAAANPAAPAWLFALCGAVFAGCCAWFIATARNIRAAALPEEGGGAARAPTRLHAGRRERASLLLCAAMPLCSLAGISFGLFVPGRVLGIAVVLAAALCWQEMGGAAAGACIGGAMVLAGGEPAVAGVFALGGLLAGLFSRGSEEIDLPGAKSNDATAAPASVTIPIAGGFALVCALYLVLQASAPDPAFAVVFAMESIAGMAIFAAVPRRAWARLRELFSSPVRLVSPEENGGALRLRAASEAVRRVAAYVEEVAAGLAQIDAPMEQSACAQAEDAVCAACADRPRCWQDHPAQAASVFAAALRALRGGQGLGGDQIEALRAAAGFARPCREPAALAAALERAHGAYTVRAGCHQKNAGLRQAAAEQFYALAELLDELRGQMGRGETFEPETAEICARVLEEYGYRVRAVSCARSAAGAAVLTACARVPEDPERSELLLRALRRATGVDFGPPAVTALEDGSGESLLSFAQQPRYHITLGAVQMSSSASDYCGDYFDCFGDGRGRELLVLSDGMGTGGRAAVDSALAAEIFSSLARGGLPSENAVRMANAALLVKSCEESLATLDAAGIDLYTGEVEFCKAGGAASFLRRGGKAERVELSALPSGILRGIRPAVARMPLQAGDVAVLVSDGMLGETDAWLCEALEGWTDGAGDMQALAEHLAAMAVQKRADGREDDLTVICAQLARGGPTRR